MAVTKDYSDSDSESDSELASESENKEYNEHGVEIVKVGFNQIVSCWYCVMIVVGIIELVMGAIENLMVSDSNIKYKDECNIFWQINLATSVFNLLVGIFTQLICRTLNMSRSKYRFDIRIHLFLMLFYIGQFVSGVFNVIIYNDINLNDNCKNSLNIWLVCTVNYYFFWIFIVPNALIFVIIYTKKLVELFISCADCLIYKNININEKNVAQIKKENQIEIEVVTN